MINHHTFPQRGKKVAQDEELARSGADENSQTLLVGMWLLLLLLLLLSHFSRVRLCATPQTAALQAPPSLGFSRQEHWNGLPFPSPMSESEK